MFRVSESEMARVSENNGMETGASPLIVSFTPRHHAFFLANSVIWRAHKHALDNEILFYEIWFIFIWMLNAERETCNNRVALYCWRMKINFSLSLDLIEGEKDTWRDLFDRKPIMPIVDSFFLCSIIVPRHWDTYSSRPLTRTINIPELTHFPPLVMIQFMSSVKHLHNKAFILIFDF